MQGLLSLCVLLTAAQFCMLLTDAQSVEMSRFHLSLVISGELNAGANSSANLKLPLEDSGMPQPDDESDLPMSVDNLPSPEEVEWREYKNKYKKNYLTEAEEMNRRKIYFENKKEIDAHNERANAMRVLTGEEGYLKGVNQFTDLTQEEFVQFLQSSGDLSMNMDNMAPAPTQQQVKDLPSKFNWRDRGGVVPVKNQGSCGSCWTFATVGALETLNFRKTKTLIAFSEQQILDCASNRKYGNQGCGGGWPSRAFQYVMDAGGIFSESQYPYLGYQAHCRIYHKPAAGKCKGFVKVQPGNEYHMAWYLANNGTLSVLVNAGDWASYSSGVYNHPYCKYGQLNHAVLLVGYTPEYWIVKNSWSQHWGEQGYIRLSRNVNMCGIANQAIIPY